MVWYINKRINIKSLLQKNLANLDAKVFRNKPVTEERFALDVEKWGPCLLYNQVDEVKDKYEHLSQIAQNSTCLFFLVALILKTYLTIHTYII